MSILPNDHPHFATPFPGVASLTPDSHYGVVFKSLKMVKLVSLQTRILDMKVRKLRLQHGWSQEQLAEFSGLSVRTIQRVERGQNAGMESLKSLAAVFEIQVSELQQESNMTNETLVHQNEAKALEYVRDLKGFYTHLGSYITTVILLFVINYIVTPGYIWAWWAAMGWGIGVISHGLSVFEVFNFYGPDWEKRQVEKRLGRKL